MQDDVNTVREVANGGTRFHMEWIPDDKPAGEDQPGLMLTELESAAEEQQILLTSEAMNCLFDFILEHFAASDFWNVPGDTTGNKQLDILFASQNHVIKQLRQQIADLQPVREIMPMLTVDDAW